MVEYNWDHFTKRITISASVPEVFQAWTTQSGLEKWFLRRAEFTDRHKHLRDRSAAVEAGDIYAWTWFGYPDSVHEHHTILETNGHDYLKFRFSGGCLVTVTVKIENGETVCELMQDMTPAEEGKKPMFFIECSRGWTFYMTNLKSILEGGIDLRNKNEAIQSVINA
ncbi:MAG TPA: SRPBCC domain-containing protein [Puia sp.]|nr:SRPBCC domain-containing protein [Puia sp.]